MLSIVPLLNGGGLFETGAGGSARSMCSSSRKKAICVGIPSVNSFALAASLEHLAKVGNNPVAKILADTLDQANAKFLESNKSPRVKSARSTTRQPLLPRAVLGAGVGGANRR